MFIENWFPTPIFYSYASTELKKAIFDEYLEAEQKILTKVSFGTWGDNISTTFDITKNILDEYKLCSLKKYVLDMGAEFTKKLHQNKCTLSIKESWVNYSAKHQYQNKHCHYSRPSMLSGVYYLQTNTQDGKLTFYPPSKAMVDQTKTPTMLTYTSIDYTPEPGKIILFPSWVEHSVRANMTDATRVSVSFNIEVDSI